MRELQRVDQQKFLTRRGLRKLFAGIPIDPAVETRARFAEQGRGIEELIQRLLDQVQHAAATVFAGIEMAVVNARQGLNCHRPCGRILGALTDRITEFAQPAHGP